MIGTMHKRWILGLLAVLLLIVAGCSLQNQGERSTDPLSSIQNDDNGAVNMDPDDVNQQEFTILSEEELRWADAKLDFLRDHPDDLPVGSLVAPGNTPVRSIYYMDQFGDTLRCVLYPLPSEGPARTAVVSVRQQTIRSLIVEMAGPVQAVTPSEVSDRADGITFCDHSGQPVSCFSINGDGLLERTDKSGIGLAKQTLSWWDRFLGCVASRWQSTVPWFIRGACFACKTPSLYGPWACYSCVIGQGYWGWIVISYCIAFT